MTMTLELSRHNWPSLTSRGGHAGNIPEAIRGLAQAESEEDARSFYWKVDNEVIFNGCLYESATATTACIVGLLPTCTAQSRSWMLELLFQLGNGHVADQCQGSDLPRSCMKEILYGVTMYFHILETGTPAELGSCIDLLVLCAYTSTELKDRVGWSFRTLLVEHRDETIVQALKDAIQEIDGIS